MSQVVEQWILNAQHMQQSTEKKDRYYIKCIMDFIRDMQAEQMSWKKQQQLKIVAFKSMGLFTYK